MNPRFFAILYEMKARKPSPSQLGIRTTPMEMKVLLNQEGMESAPRPCKGLLAKTGAPPAIKSERRNATLPPPTPRTLAITQCAPCGTAPTIRVPGLYSGPYGAYRPPAPGRYAWAPPGPT